MGKSVGWKGQNGSIIQKLFLPWENEEERTGKKVVFYVIMQLGGVDVTREEYVKRMK